MTQEEYKQQLNQIEIEATERRKLLNRQYARENREHGIGDILTDTNGSILVQKFGIDFDSNRVPVTYYFGVELKKDLTPTKAGKTRSIWPSSIIAVIKKVEPLNKNL